MQLLDPAGGLGYHWRAMRYRHRLWAPFISRVAGWLHAWQAPTTHLVIVGSSSDHRQVTPCPQVFSHGSGRSRCSNRIHSHA